MPITTLTAALAKCRHAKPLVTLDGLPGEGAELRPDELRRLAAALLRIADDAEARPTKGKAYVPVKKAYPLT